MGFIDKFKKWTTEDEYEDDGADLEEEEYEDEGYFAKRPAKGEPAERRPAGGLGGGIQVVLVRPERYEDASAIADHLGEKKTVVLNLESTNKDVARRLIDFLSGVAYANNGQLKRVANSTFIITPYNVNIMGDIIDELENSGVYF